MLHTIETNQCQHNVLVNEAGSAVLTDFGRAKVIGEAGFSTTMFAGHISSMAPELLPPDDSVDVDKLFSEKSDIYAFGMLCYKVSSVITGNEGLFNIF